MADRVYMPTPLDSNGDVVSDAEAYFYERGTTTPLTVYTDENAATPHASPVTMVDGAFPAVFTTQALKMDIVDGEGASIPGYPIDPAYVSPATALGAAAITFSPITGNPATNVQVAIQNLTTLWNGVTTFSRTLMGKATASDWRVALGLTDAATAEKADQATAEAGTDDSDYMTALTTAQAISAQVESPVKAWVNFGGLGTVAIRASMNVSSITDEGTGKYTVNFTDDMEDANYATLVSGRENLSGAAPGSNYADLWRTSQAAGSVVVGSSGDFETVNVVILR